MAAATSVESAAILQLPAEISCHMLDLLPSATLANAARACKLWSGLCANILPARHAQLCLAGIENALIGHDRYRPPVSREYERECLALKTDPEIQTKTLVIERWKAYTHFFRSKMTGMMRDEPIIHEAIRRLIIDNRPDHLQALLGSAIRNCLDSDRDGPAIYLMFAARLDRRACLSHLLRDHKMHMPEEPPLPPIDEEEEFTPIEEALNTALFAGCTECVTLLLKSVTDPAQAIRDIQTRYNVSARRASYPQESIAFMESILNPKT